MLWNPAVADILYIDLVLACNVHNNRVVVSVSCPETAGANELLADSSTSKKLFTVPVKQTNKQTNKPMNTGYLNLRKFHRWTLTFTCLMEFCLLFD